MHRDYERVEAVIRYLEGHAGEQPELAELADHVGVSPAHLQRTFRRWAGISPKRFLQFITAKHARRLLEIRPNLQEVAWDAGLSGPGRLHDLLVNVHAMTPAEARAGGAGVELVWGLHPSPFGPCLLAVSPRGVAFLSFPEMAPSPEGPPDPWERTGSDEADPPQELQEAWPEARFRRDPQTTGALVRRIFAAPDGTEPPRPLTLHIRGTNFQIRVWEALLRIPAGRVVTYGDLAEAVGSPQGARAVGSAVGRNPISWIIPCHRVIRGTGILGEYRWGSARKKAMLGWEAARSPSP